MNNRCVFCNAIIPEGRMVCPTCENKTFNNLEDIKFCPLRSVMCDKEKCAWWCKWLDCCAMVAIPAEIANKMEDIMNTLR